MISRFSRRPITTLPGRRRNHRAASPARDRRHFGVLPRSGPAGCESQCDQLISATMAPTITAPASPRSNRRQQDQAEKSSTARRESAAMLERILVCRVDGRAVDRRWCATARRCLIAHFTVFSCRPMAPDKVLGLTFREHITIMTAPPDVGGPTGAKRMSIFPADGSSLACADDDRHRRHRPAR